MAQPSALGNQRYVNTAEARSDMGLASQAVTATGVKGTAFDVEDAVSIQATLTTSAASGTTPSVTITLETTVDGTNWDTVASFPAVTASGVTRGKVFGPLGVQCRWNATAVTGTTPSITLAIAVSVRRGK